jgi:CubicO group peptidase (beta-lactamase class C family)/pimeloyl-ACP methyl ester carboxylesterase
MIRKFFEADVHDRTGADGLIDRRTMLAGVGAATLLPGLARATSRAAGPGAGAAQVPGFEQIDAQAQRWLEEGVYPGLSIIVARGGRTIFERYYGTFTSDTVTHVASAGKWLAAATIATVVDEGKLGWDDTPARFIAGLNPMMARATLRQLLSHTAGYPDYQPAGQPVDHYQTLTESVDHILPLMPDCAPGTRFRYGGLAMQVAGRMAECATGQAWNDLFLARIAEPLRMSQSGYAPVSLEDGFSPTLGGGLFTSARDMMRFLDMIRVGGTVGARRILSPAAIHEMQADQVRAARIAPLEFVDQARADRRSDVYGLGEWREEIDQEGVPTLISSPGWAGTYPWIDRRSDVHGVVLAKLDVPRGNAAGFNAFLSSPVMPWLVRDALADDASADRQRGFVAVPGGRLYWEASGSGPPLVLLHGHSFDRTMWDPQVEALSRRHRVIRYDMRGYGRSSLPTEPQAFTHADDLVRLMDALHFDRAHVVGLLLGGAVVTDMLALHPDRLLSATVASGDFFDVHSGPDEPWTADAVAKRRAEIAAIRAGGVWRFKRDWLDQLTAHGGTRVDTIRPQLWKMISIWSAWQPLHLEPRRILGHDAADRLKAQPPGVPTLILTPEIMANEPNRLAPLLPDVRIVVIRDAGPVSNLEQPEAFLAALTAFLDEVTRHG